MALRSISIDIVATLEHYGPRAGALSRFGNRDRSPLHLCMFAPVRLHRGESCEFAWRLYDSPTFRP